MREHRVGTGQGDGRCGVGTGAVQRGRKAREAGGSSGREAGHRWAVAAVLNSTTADAAETTTKKKKNMHWHIEHTNIITRAWVPAAWLSGPMSRVAGKEQEQQGPSQTESSLTVSPCPSKKDRVRDRLRGPRAAPAQECLGRTWKYARTRAHHDTFPCCSAECRDGLS